MLAFERELERDPGRSIVLVVGDVNSTLACALVAIKEHFPVAHVEAGLRCFDPWMPEEINRRLTDHLSTYLFTTSRDGDENLEREGIPSRPRALRRQHDDRHAAAVPRRRGASARRRTRLGLPGRGLRGPDAPPAEHGRRARAARRGPRRRDRRQQPAPGRVPGAPTDAAAPGSGPSSRLACTRRRASSRSSRSAISTSSACSTTLAARAHRLGRDPGGDDGARRPLPDPACRRRSVP